jgi:hypothetical protein
LCSVPFSNIADEVHAYAYELLAGDYSLLNAADSALPSETSSGIAANVSEARAREAWEKGITALACLGDDVPTALQHLMLGTLDPRVRDAVEVLAQRHGCPLPDQATTVLRGIRTLAAGGVVHDYKAAWELVRSQSCWSH